MMGPSDGLGYGSASAPYAKCNPSRAVEIAKKCLVRLLSSAHPITLRTPTPLYSPTSLSGPIGRLQGRLPDYVEIVEWANGQSSKPKRPPVGTVAAGYQLELLAVGLFTKQHKPLWKQASGMHMRLSHTPHKGGLGMHPAPLLAYHDKPFSGGKYVFKPMALPRDAVHPSPLTVAGVYRFDFKSDFPEVKPKVYEVTVVATHAATLHASLKPPLSDTETDPEAQSGFCLGAPLPPIFIFFRDAFGNLVHVSPPPYDPQLTMVEWASVTSADASTPDSDPTPALMPTITVDTTGMEVVVHLMQLSAVV